MMTAPLGGDNPEGVKDSLPFNIDNMRGDTGGFVWKLPASWDP